MSIEEDWARCYARQANADFKAWRHTLEHPTDLVAECHSLLFLQMACEKLCKAHLLRNGSPPDKIRSSHAYIAKPLPVIIRQEISLLEPDARSKEWVINHTKDLAREIELLNPSVDNNGQNKENCEYPWESNGKIFSPLDRSFSPLHLLTQAAGRTFIKLLGSAIERNERGS
jgi:hypothetical protein